jgi:hypothetical protein
MIEQNFDYLKNQLKYTGFGEDLYEKLKESLQSGKPDFTLFHSQNFGKDSVVATLQFRKSETNEMYFFNRYSILLKNNLHPEAAKQTFFVNKDQDTVTLKEAYNLMSGRAVFKELSNKENEKYNAWIQLDFKSTDASGNFGLKKFNENYFNLGETLKKYPIKEMVNDEERDRIIRSLQRGNMQAVHLINGDKPLMYLVEVAPQFKSLNFYDNNMKRVMRESLALPKVENGQHHEVKKEVKSASAEEDEGPRVKEKKRLKKNVQSH